MQLPTFPEFVSIRDINAHSVDGFTHNLQPYSDLNFSNIWSWNIDGSFKAAELNGNLVLFMRDAKSKEFFLCLAGTNEVNETLDAIFEIIDQSDISQTLALIPEETAALVNPNLFSVSEDRDSFDYVYSTELLSTLPGRKYKSKRHLINQFTESHPDFEVLHKKLTPAVKLEILQFMSHENRKRAASGYTPFVEYEMAALEHFFLLPENDKLIVSILYCDQKLTGFTIDEIQFNNCVLSHFFKVNSDLEYRGVYDTLNTSVAKFFYSNNLEYWNWVEDLGSEGLRQAKMSYRPVKMLKKYTISKYA